MAYWFAVGIAIRLRPMSAIPGFRAELANQVILHLRSLSDLQWQRAEDRLAQGRTHFDMAWAVAEHAIDILVEAEGEESRTALLTRLQDVEREYGDTSDGATPASRERARIAHAAVQAVYLRDSRGFNHGAFEALFAPVAGAIDVTALEAVVNASAGPQATDFRTGPWQVPRVHPTPGRRRRA
jgi:hypothetical protein